MDSFNSFKSTINSVWNQPGKNNGSSRMTKNFRESCDCIGIDFGNSNICVSYYKDQEFKIFQLEAKGWLMPACFTLKENGEFFVGNAAKNMRNQKKTKMSLFDLRRCVTSNKVISDAIPFQLKENMIVEQNGMTMPLIRSIAVIILFIKKQMETELEQIISNVVLTIPSGTTLKQQQTMVDACRIAGLHIMGLLYEPVAAAITYYIRSEIKERKSICVIDFGGAKLDVAAIAVENGKIELLACASNLELGGRDFDERMVKYFLAELQQKYPNLLIQQKHITLIREKCIVAKENLTSRSEVSMDLEIGEEDITMSVTRQKFEEITEDLTESTKKLVNSVVSGCSEAISDVILVGGTSRIPKIQASLQQIFPQIPLNKTLNADESIAKGAAIYGTSLSGLIKKLEINSGIPWDMKQPLCNPTMETFVDKNGRVQRRVIEAANNDMVDIKEEIIETKNIFVTNEHVTLVSQNQVEIANEVDPFLSDILEPQFAERYQQQGYTFLALKHLKKRLANVGNNADKNSAIEFFVPRVKICIDAIELFQKWVPHPCKSCSMLSEEVKTLCEQSSYFKENDLYNHSVYLKWIGYWLYHRQRVAMYQEKDFEGSLKSQLKKVHQHLNDLHKCLENYLKIKLTYEHSKELEQSIDDFFKMLCPKIQHF